MRQVPNSVVGTSVFLWAIGTCWSFWYLEAQYLRPVERPAGASIAAPQLLPPPPIATFATETGQVALSNSEPVTVLNFWNPLCPCARFAEPDVEKLISMYSARGVRFITIIAAGDGNVPLAYRRWSDRHISGTIAVADLHNQIAMKFGVWAAPAAVILDPQGHIKYVGGYNAARYCSNPDTAWAAKALAEVLQGKKPTRSKTLFFGCQLNSDAG